VRVAVPEKKDTDALKHIIPQVQVPIVADVHFHFQRALEAVEAGVHKIRLNPGNINDREQVIEVINACKARKLPIRVGVNEGSIIERRDKQKRMKELGAVFSDKKHGYLLAIMIAKLEEYLDVFYEQDFYDIVISAKSMDAALVIDAYTEISNRFDHPLHLGVTHAGPKETGCIRSIAALSGLLINGIGDTIRVSLTPDPGAPRENEVIVAQEILQTMGLRHFTPMVIACPGCGRTTSTTFQELASDIQSYLRQQMPIWKKTHPGVENMNVAVMGCIVNGPGESKHANIGISLPGTGETPAAPVFVDGVKVKTLRGDNIAQDFQVIVDEYVKQNYAAKA
jgi:(E)-4-hydroxy-3-methylbut-2-enyl-diphosphate synthase